MAFRGKSVAALAAGAALALTGLVGCAAGPSDDDGESEIRIAVGATEIPGTWDPFDGAALYSPTLHPVYEPLIRDEGGYSPGLAESWEAAPDGASIEFTLSEGMTYHDGTPVTAESVVEYFSALFGDEDSPIHPLIVERDIQIKVTGDLTLEMSSGAAIKDFRTTTVPYGWLGGLPVISPAATEDRSILEDGPQGTGPYLVEEYIPEVSVTYVRNPDYWNPDDYPFDTVTYIAYADDVAILNALKSGQVDTGVLGANLIEEAKAEGLNVTTALGPTTWLEVMDLDGSIVTALGDVRVRQAMNMAFDREAIGDAINHGYGYATSQLFTDTAIEYVEGGDDRYPYDPEAAKELLAEAGYPDGFELRFTVLEDWGAEYHPVIEQSLGDIGIHVTFDRLPYSEAGKLIGEVWPSAPLALSTIPVAEGNAEFFIPATWNHTSEEIAELKVTAERGSNDERVEALTELGPLMLDEARFIPIGVIPTFFVSRPGFDVEMVNSFARWPYLKGYLKVE